MCKPQRSTPRATEPATGPTTRLGEGEPAENRHYMAARSRSWRSAHFPWWMLWLIWPLIGIGKAVAPAVIGALGSLSQLTTPLLPVILVVLGVALLIRMRRGG